MFSFIVGGDFKIVSESGLNLMKELIFVFNIFGLGELEKKIEEVKKVSGFIVEKNSESINIISKSSDSKIIFSDINNVL